MATSLCTVPLTPSARIAANLYTWRNGLRGHRHSPLDRFNDAEAVSTPQTAPLLTHFAPITRPGLSAAVACIGRGPHIVHLSGRWHGGVAFEASDDGTRWRSVELVAFSSGMTAKDTTAPGMWRLPHELIGGFFRIAVYELTAGAVYGVIAAAPLPTEQGARLSHAA